MARRTVKKLAAKSETPYRSPHLAICFKELPGAMFYADGRVTDIDDAIQMQVIRADYERTDCIITLWQDLGKAGWGSDEIERAVLNPAIITSCGYGVPLGDGGGLRAFSPVRGDKRDDAAKIDNDRTWFALTGSG
jgi:hypothetical protein